MLTIPELLVSYILVPVGFYSLKIYKNSLRVKLSNCYNEAIIHFKTGNASQATDLMTKVVMKKDSTYSPLALYFLIDNSLIKEKREINKLFDILINKSSTDYEVKNLIIYKKALFNSDTITENELLEILKPLINSKSIWKSHALYLIAEFFYSKNQKQKSKEFFNEIVILDNANKDIIIAAQKRLSRDLGD